MKDKKIEEIIQYIEERYYDIQDWLDKKIWEAEVDLAYQAIEEEAKRRGVPESEIWRELMEIEEAELE